MRTSFLITTALLGALGPQAVAASRRGRGGEATQETVVAALTRALTVPEGRVVLKRLHPLPDAQCAARAAEIPKAIERSGRVAVKLTGAGCPDWTWADIEVRAAMIVTARAVRAGEALASAVTHEERAVTAAPFLRALPEGAVAARALGAGAPVGERDARVPGAAAGAPVKVVIHSGPLALAQSGRLVPCGAGRACAVLPSGKRVEGLLADGVLTVEIP